MEFNRVSNIASLLAKSFARDFFRLLVTHVDISASEAASRLDLHIKTAQDFLEGLYHEGIVARNEAVDGKRPYYRYSLERRNIKIDLNLDDIFKSELAKTPGKEMLRERKNNGAVFYTPGNQDYISSISLFVGEGRQKKERKISLTKPQGKFLFHLPFPNSDYKEIREIMKKAELPQHVLPEVFDVVGELIQIGIIETK
jgi:predicted transcriptional regulator